MSPPPPQAEQTPKLDTFLIAPPQQPTVAIQPPPAAAEPKKEAAPPVPAAPVPRDLVASLVRDAPSPTPAPPLRLAPTQERPRVPAEVAAGYQSLRTGDFAAARKSYAAALAAEPTNIDALLGSATIEARTGNRMLAMSHYRRALDVDPRNPTAIAGLASVADSLPDGLESQLRSEIARNPQSPQLHFTLGNLFASQSRWNDAQVEFFEAYRLDPANADVIFNLAVSLDRLGQGRLAAEHYRRALEAARQQSTQFDPAAVQRRLADLKQ
jgi:Tfp pilus assembly protein PilF